MAVHNDHVQSPLFCGLDLAKASIGAEHTTAGTGDFFGELALLVADRRNSDVVALGYCQLLSLAARDLRRLLVTGEQNRCALLGASAHHSA